MPLTIPISSMQARVSELRAEFQCSSGVTHLVSKYHTAPIKIAKVFPLGGPAGVIVMDVSPGLLAGDRYELEWKIGPNAHVYMTNQSFTKVHPCGDPVRGGSSIVQKFQLQQGAVVESMPEPIMLYKDAAFVNETEVQLSSGSVWMQAEIVCPGRTLRGERFQYRSYRNRLRVRHEGELIYAQNGLIEPGKQLLTAPGCLGGMTHTGVLYAFSDAITSRHVEAVRNAIAALPQREGQPVLAGVTATHKFGIAVMTAGMAAWPLQEVLAEAWQTLRRVLLHQAPLQFHK
ncbi:urease accessory protein UreD [Paenibacillus oenotherae]|uniref:Urease accessory protein UreD n=2 Tax=Paenibacillus oenotherae TaxID=1435645 RepID=A0ABS7D1Q1_9BACL|nr:urease accessory protein UreD [Paenibacillus oenotherae]